MKNISHLMILFLALFIQQIKAEMVVTFNKDSVPPLFKELNAHYANPEKYLPLWNKIKQSIDAEKETRRQIIISYTKVKSTSNTTETI